MKKVVRGGGAHAYYWPCGERLQALPIIPTQGTGTGQFYFRTPIVIGPI
jgi:hypothetical protein